MEEFVLYLGQPTKIGAGQNLALVSYSRLLDAIRTQEIARQAGNLDPESYTDPDYGFVFRFPYPDEDVLPFGNLQDRPELRSLIVKLERGGFFPIGSFPKLICRNTLAFTQRGELESIENPNNPYPLVFLELYGQTPIKIEGRKALALIYRCPFSSKQVVVRDWLMATYITAQIRKAYIERSADHRAVLFWTEVVRRINRGYFDPEAIHEPVDLPYLF